MFGDLFDKFKDIDVQKLLHVVDLVWDNRDRILEIVENLPEMLQETGESIEGAGASAAKAGIFLAGQGSRKGAAEISDLAASALVRCEKEIQDAARIMDKIGREIDDINIPSFRPKYTKIGSIKVMSGMDFSESKLVDNAADRLKDGSDRLEEIGKDLRAVAVHLKDLGGVLDEAGGDLGGLGEKLQKSGATLRGFGSWSG